MKSVILTCLLLCACAAQPETIYAPVETEKAVAVTCKIPLISQPTDLLAALPPTASLTDGMKACLAQHDSEIGYNQQMMAAIATCQ